MHRYKQRLHFWGDWNLVHEAAGYESEKRVAWLQSKDAPGLLGSRKLLHLCCHKGRDIKKFLFSIIWPVPR